MRKQIAAIVLCAALSASAGAFVAGTNSVTDVRVAVSPLDFDCGGWSLDAQFSEAIGSPCLLAHGLGRAVADARAEVFLPEAGRWRVWVRSRNWLPEDACGGADPWPGSFSVTVNGRPLSRDFGCGVRVWAWEDGGEVNLTTACVEVVLRDRTGFDGRCGGVIFEKGRPSADRGPLFGMAARKGRNETCDLVVVGGGMSGCSAAVAAARRGLKVALIQDRPVLGGNASGEIRVWSGGEIRHPIVRELRGKFPIRDANLALSDAERLRIVRREPNIRLHLGTRVFAANRRTDGRIESVTAVSLSDNRVHRFQASFFCDATGDGGLGAMAGATCRMGREGRGEYGEEMAPERPDGNVLGASIMWTSAEANDDVAFSAPWAEPYACGQTAVHGEWFWEYGIGRDMIFEAEEIRDRLLLAIYGAFSRAKRDPANSRRMLDFCPFILGKRESRRILGAYTLTENDILAHREFADAVATGSWALDQHTAGREGFPGVDFVATSHEPRHFGRYWIPWRTLYSAEIPNLLMAGRCLSASHIALCSARVINTGAQTGVAAGIGAALCLEHGCDPADLLEPSRMRAFQRAIGGDWPGNPDPAHAGWLYVDDEDEACVSFEGDWYSWYTPSGGQCGNLSHFPHKAPGPATCRLPVDEPGEYELYARIPYRADIKKPSRTEYEILTDGKSKTFVVDMSLDTGSWRKIGTAFLRSGSILRVDPRKCTGTLIVDGFAVVRVRGVR